MSIQALSLAQAETTKKMLAEIWQRNRITVSARLDLLEGAASAIAHESLTPTLLEEALLISHTLAGSLGMFGFGEGTQLARDLEQQLKSGTPNAVFVFDSVSKMRRVLFGDAGP